MSDCTESQRMLEGLENTKYLSPSGHFCFVANVHFAQKWFHDSKYVVKGLWEQMPTQVAILQLQIALMYLLVFI